ncbi:MAG: hypothetical protein PHG87_00780 [Candidatus Omnitrophica bacterium]|nr:hypothetical protein [Candidatus Omnitrophota bacterium]
MDIGAVLLQLMKQLNSSVFVLLAMLGCLFWVVYKVGKWSEKFKHHADKILRIENLAEKFIELKTKVDLIYDNTNPRKTVAAMSPISLTETGKDIVSKISANKILEKYLPQLVKEVELENPKNAYDIQMSSMKLAKEKMIAFLNEEELNTIKQEAYSRGIIVQDVMSVFGVLLRNHILNLKSIPISDVDVHSPAKQKIS